MTLSRLRLVAAVALVSGPLIAGCSSSNTEPPTQVAEQMPEPKVTADSHYAAGQFHERAVVGKPGEDASRQVRMARKQAVRQYEKALDLDAKHAPSLYRLAALATEDRDVEEAEAFWRRYIDATNNAPAAWRNLAVSLDLLGEVKKAEEAYRQTLAFDPDDDAARVNLGMLLARENRISEARTELSRALAPADVHYHIAQALRRKDKPEAAAAELRAAAAIDSRYANTDQKTSD